MSRGVAVVVFTDLVGSTELRSRLGEEAAEELRRRHDTLIGAAIRINRGRLVKHLGDGVMATFTAASDAVSAGVRIQQVLERHNRSGAVGLHVRVGISAGDVVFEKGDCFGSPVVEAARLCGAAQGGQVLLSDVVRLLAGTVGSHQFAAVGELELKGLPAPLPSFDVAWQPLPMAPLPLPAFLTGLNRLFVGREAQTDHLLRLWKEAAAGERRVVFVAGEPGIGKTRLAAELAGLAHDEGAAVLAGRCDEHLGVPYQPFVEALRHFVEHVSPAGLADSLGRYSGELVRLLPELADRVGGLPPPLRSDPETERYRLFDAVAAWLGSVSAERPVLFVVDDLHWAAKPTLLLLRHITRSCEDSRILVVCTYRDTEPGDDLVDVLAGLRRQTGIDRMSLAGLDPAGVIAFVEEASRHPLEDEDVVLARAIHEETEGNPFFVREVLRHLAETGALERRSRLRVVGAGIPDSIRDVVGQRLSRLSKSANEVLRVAAVAGAEFDLPVLQAAGRFDDDALVSALEEAATARLVMEAADRYRFAHALVRDTLYDELSSVRRGVLHRRLGEAIEAVHENRLDDHLPALAYHWARASAPASKAVDYATRAGDRALAQLAYDEAVVFYRQALELLDVGDAGSRALELLITLGEAQRRAGDAGHREALLGAADLAHRCGDSSRLARAALANYRGFYSTTGAVDVERVVVLEDALRAVGPADSPTRARLLANLGSELHFSDERRRRRELSDDALDMARRLGDPLTLAHVVMARCTAIWHPENAAERLVNTAELLTLAESIRDPAALAWASCWRFIAAMELADVGEADRNLERLAAVTAELGQPTFRWILTYLRVGRVLFAGELQEADTLAVDARELGTTAGHPDAELYFRTQRFQIRFEQGDLARVVDRMVVDDTSSPAVQAVAALAYCEVDRDDDARRVFDPLAAKLTDVGEDVGWLYTMATSAVVSAHLADQSTAAPLLDLLTPYAAHVVGNALVWTGSVSYYLGLLAATLRRFDEAEASFAAAEATHERVRAPTWLARTRLEWARMLLTRRQPSDVDRARELLAQALAAARDLGLANVERRAVAMLQVSP